MRKTLRPYFPLFLLPTLLAFVMAFIIPFVMGVGLSFTSFTTVDSARFVGVDNYIKAFAADSGFLYSLGFTTLFTIVSVVTVNVLAFFETVRISLQNGTDSSVFVKFCYENTKRNSGELCQICLAVRSK